LQERCLKTLLMIGDQPAECQFWHSVTRTQERPESIQAFLRRACPATRQLAVTGAGPGADMPVVESSTDCIDPVWVGSTGAGGTSGVTGWITSVKF
jgi:hypothetical protein